LPIGQDHTVHAFDPDSVVLNPRKKMTDAANPNGSASGIAGLCSDRRNVVGLMPHPERACESALGSVDGLQIFRSAVDALNLHRVLQTA